MQPAAWLKRSILVAHRWMGVVFCALFLCWFLSGIVLIYCDYPMVSSADRLAHSVPLDPNRIRISPAEAFSRLGDPAPPDEVILESLASRLVYRFDVAGAETVVYADSGELISDFPPPLTLQVAAAWTNLPATQARSAELTQPDQWTVSGEFAPLRPLRQYSWPDGQEVYVSTVTGEVVQYTTRASRLGAWFGPIPHWLYFTPLRKRGLAWSRLVIWASGLATIAAALGLTLGIWMYAPSPRYGRAGRRSRIPYLGQKRWHMLLGLLFGPLACTWVFSGMLSMDPFPQLQGDGFDALGERIADALRPSLPSVEEFAALSPPDALRSLPLGFVCKRLEFAFFNGQPVYIATAAASQSVIIRLTGPAAGKPLQQFDANKILDLVRRAAAPAAIEKSSMITHYDAYYLDRHNRLPLPALRIELKDPAHSLYYIDPRIARVMSGYTRNGRWNRWLYHGLHSLDLPWLYRHRPLWDVMVLSLLLGGTALCVTSLILAWRVLQRSFP